MEVVARNEIIQYSVRRVTRGSQGRLLGWAIWRPDRPWESVSRR